MQFDNYTLEDLAFLRGALDSGLKRTLTPIQHRRLELLRKSFELSALCIEVAVRERGIVSGYGSDMTAKFLPQAGAVPQCVFITTTGAWELL